MCNSVSNFNSGMDTARLFMLCSHFTDKIAVKQKKDCEYMNPWAVDFYKTPSNLDPTIINFRVIGIYILSRSQQYRDC